MVFGRLGEGGGRSCGSSLGRVAGSYRLGAALQALVNPQQIRPTPTEWASAPFQSSRNGKEHRGQSASASLVGLNPSGRGVALGEALPRPHRVHPLSLQMRSTITAHDAPS